MAVKKYLDLNGLTAYNNKLKTVYPKNIAYGNYTPTGGSTARKGFHYDLDVESSGTQSTYTYTLVDLNTIITDLSIPTVSASASYNDGLTIGSVTVDSTTTNIKVPTFVGAYTDEQGLSREGLVPTATYTQATENKFLSAYGDWRVPVNTTYSGSSVGGEESISIDANNVIWNHGVRDITPHESTAGTFMVYYGNGNSNSITVPGFSDVSYDASRAVKGVNIGGTVTSGSVSGGTDATITDDKKAVFTTLPASTLSGTTSTSLVLGNGVTATTQSQGDNSTKVATTAYVDTAIDNLPEPMIFSGGVTVVETVAGTSPNYTYTYSVTLPNDITALVEGYTFKVISASGSYPSGYSGSKVAVGDTFIVANPGDINSHVTVNTSWTIIPSGDEPNGTVTEVATGIGLTGGPINSSGTIKANLQSETKLGANATTESTPGSVTTQIYPVLADNSGKLAVHVPWTDTHGEVTSVAGKTGAVTLTASDVGLGNVTNNAQVKGLASGTTSGHIVTWGSDGYTVADSGKSISTTLDTTKDTEIPTSKAIDTYVTGKGYVTTDTKNTTGSTADASKLFLVGAKEQSANPQTYSQANVYATAGKLYSNAVEVVNLSDSQALTNKTYNGLTLTEASTGFTVAGGTTSKTLTVIKNYTLAGACAKEVDETLSSTSSTNLPTSHAVAIYLQNFVDDSNFNNRIGIAYDTGTYDSTNNLVNVSNLATRLKPDGIYTVKITNNVFAGASLKYTNTTAKPIYVNGAAVESNVITDGMTVTFRYTGTVFEAILLPITDSAIDSLFTS